MHLHNYKIYSVQIYTFNWCYLYTQFLNHCYALVCTYKIVEKISVLLAGYYFNYFIWSFGFSEFQDWNMGISKCWNSLQDMV